jgi:hypothetical protein
MQLLPLTNAPGLYALVDDDTYTWAQHSRWLRKRGPKRATQYAYRRTRGPDGKVREEFLHRLVLGLAPSDPRQVDHADLNGLDNQRRNLRAATPSENFANRNPRKDTKTGFKGVSRHRASGKWQVKIAFNRTCYPLGLYESPQEAAEAYNVAATLVHRDFARLNVIPPEHRPTPERQQAIHQRVTTLLARHGIQSPTPPTEGNQPENQPPKPSAEEPAL